MRSAGDMVKIGRDKRVCKICLGVNAQGVSRVHMSIELKQQGSRLIVCLSLLQNILVTIVYQYV